MIQEVIFFDKHTSRLHRQIIAIAPLQPDRATSTDPMLFLRQSIKFWVLYKDLRPYLASNYISNNGNEQKRVTFDDFFQKRLYTSYLVGENNIYNRMILDYAKEEQSAKKEQARIETELLNFEQDLWEY
jgi:gliding motility associated protien GldN